MVEQAELARLYLEARSALNARDFDRASDLLRQILLVDETYKDASRLLAQAVKLKRRRWYSHPLLWSAVGAMVIAALGFLIAPQWRALATESPTALVAGGSPSAAPVSTMTALPTETLPPTATPIPLIWKRVSLGQEFERDTVTAFVIDPQDPEVLYAGMDNAGIFKSIDGGLSWHPSHFGLSNTHVKSLSIDPENQRILYVGTLGGIFQTQNAGDTWFQIGEGTHLLMDPQDSIHLYARDSEDIRESIDQGKSWKTIYSSSEGCPDKIYSWAIHPADGKTVFMIGGGEGDWGVYESNDGARSWTLIDDYRFEIPAGANVLDWGVENLTVGLDGQGNLDIQHGAVAMYDSAGSVYTYWDEHLLRTHPGDDRVIRLGKPEVEIGSNTVTVIAISSFDPNTIYVGGNGISVSQDGGLTWMKLNNGLGNTFLKLDAGMADEKTLFLLEGDCRDIQLRGTMESVRNLTQPLYLSANGGDTWNQAPQSGCYLLKDADGSTLYRVGEPNKYSNGAWYGWIWRSSNIGKSWEKVSTPKDLRTLTIDPFQSGTLLIYTASYYGEGNETGYISEDYGHSWKRTEPPIETKPCYGSTLQLIDAFRPMAIDPRDGNHVLVIDNGVLLESHNSCETTDAFATAPSTSMNSITFDQNEPNTLYAGTDEGAYVSFDGGQTWNQINDGLLGATVVYSIVVDKDGNVYAATPYGIFKLEEK